MDQLESWNTHRIRNHAHDNYDFLVSLSEVNKKTSSCFYLILTFRSWLWKWNVCCQVRLNPRLNIFFSYSLSSSFFSSHDPPPIVPVSREFLFLRFLWLAHIFIHSAIWEFVLCEAEVQNWGHSRLHWHVLECLCCLQHYRSRERIFFDRCIFSLSFFQPQNKGLFQTSCQDRLIRPQNCLSLYCVCSMLRCMHIVSRNQNIKLRSCSERKRERLCPIKNIYSVEKANKPWS